MSVPIDIGDTFEWTENYKAASKGDTVLVSNIWVDEDANAQVDVINYEDRKEWVSATDIQEKVEDGLLEKVE